MAAAKAIPEGYNTVNVYLVVRSAAEALEFYRKAFGAKQSAHLPGPGGRGTMHAEMRIGNSTVMMSDENPQWGNKAPGTLGGSPVTLHLYVEDADALFKRATEAGCEVVYPMNDTFWGDRYGKLKDPFGHQWGIATHKEDVPEAELARRAEEWFKNMGQ